MIRRAGEMQMNNGNVKSVGGSNYGLPCCGSFFKGRSIPAVNYLHIFYSVECENVFDFVCKCFNLI